MRGKSHHHHYNIYIFRQNASTNPHFEFVIRHVAEKKKTEKEEKKKKAGFVAGGPA